MKEVEKPTEKILCFFKCAFEKKKKLLEIDAEYKQFGRSESELQNKMLEAQMCLKNISHVETCQDMKSILQCIPFTYEKPVFL